MQIVGYDTSDPALWFDDGGSLDRVALAPGTDLAYTLGARRCAGTIHEDGHVACTEPDAPFCDAHSDVWVCARCTGTCLKDEMDCFDEHAVYLACFAPGTYKVGVTKRRRLETRLREQGADRGAHIRTVENGRVAREIEAGLAEEIPDRIRVATKRESLGASVDEAAWESFLAGFDVRERFAFEYGLDLSERPLAETMATGTVRGTKGRLLVLERGASTYAVDMRDLVGYEVDPVATDRDRQSSLGAFG